MTLRGGVKFYRLIGGIHIPFRRVQGNCAEVHVTGFCARDGFLSLLS